MPRDVIAPSESQTLQDLRRVRALIESKSPEQINLNTMEMKNGACCIAGWADQAGLFSTSFMATHMGTGLFGGTMARHNEHKRIALRRLDDRIANEERMAYAQIVYRD